ncbi:stc1 domain-containing protein [Purpureocillium lilacinum]|uniref:Stc1 domain-containing protein n=2 Tax=Purpureocillium lilacinum TaxID=33203 RepID=A0A179GXK0_PURLI|nr:stc1 domain-containing protein [Purpureocillium lilacinum]
MAGPQESKLNTNHDITYSHGARFKCKMGGEWLPITEFSRNQRKLIDHQVGRGGRVDTANSGMICRHHTTSTVREIRCELCQLIKPENEFSTNSKKSGDNLCRRCVAWGETQEPEVTPFALETGHISVEEDVKKPGDRRYWDEADFFVGAKPQAPMEDLEGLGLEHLSLDQLEKARSAISHNTAGGRGEASGAGTPAHTSSTVGSRGRSQAPGLPPHLARGRGSGTTNNEASGLNTPAHPSSMADSRERSQAPALPPHLARARGSAMDSETDSASLKMSGSRASSSGAMPAPAEVAANNLPPHLRSRITPAPSAAAPSVSGGRPASTVSTATTVRDERQRRQEASQVVFNAWGPDGQRRTAVKTPTVVSTTDQSSVANDTSEFEDDGWQVASGGRGNRGRNNWHKAPRMPQAELGTQTRLTHISARCDDPVAEAKRRAEYCHSDDSDY